MIALVVFIGVALTLVLGVRYWLGPRAPEGDHDLASRWSTSAAARSVAPPRPRVTQGTASWETALDRWVGAALLRPEEAAAIRRFEWDQGRAGAVPETGADVTRRLPALAEALGYLGGVLAVVGLVLLVAHYWPSLAIQWRLVMSAGVAATLAGVGAAVPEARHPALARLRGFVWLAAMAASGLFGGVVAHDAWGLTRPSSLILWTAVSVGAVGLAMWRLRPRPLQQLVTLAALVAALGAATAQFATPGVVGLVIAAVGIGVVASSRWRRMPSPWLNLGVGSLALFVAGLVIRAEWTAPGLIFSVVTAVVMLGVVEGTRFHLDRAPRLIVAAVGLVTLATGVPPAIGFFAPHAGLVTGWVMWLAGAVVGILASRHGVRDVGLIEVASGAVLLGGAAVSAAQSQGFATILGFLTALALLAWGTRPDRVAFSFLGAAGLLVFVPWAVVHYFPGPGRAPLVILIAGVLFLGLALWLARLRDRIPQGFSALLAHRGPRRHGRVS